MYAYIHLQLRGNIVLYNVQELCGDHMGGMGENKSKENGLTLSMSNDSRIITKANWALTYCAEVVYRYYLA